MVRFFTNWRAPDKSRPKIGARLLPALEGPEPDQGQIRSPFASGLPRAHKFVCEIMSSQNSYMHDVKRLLVLGLPLVGGHLAQFAIHMTDTIMLGWYSVEALAAAVLGGTYFFVQFIFLSGFAMAVVPAVASAAANNDERQIRRITRMAIWISVLAGLGMIPALLVMVLKSYLSALERTAVVLWVTIGAASSAVSGT